jgi:signal transduction histidine kinase
MENIKNKVLLRQLKKSKIKKLSNIDSESFYAFLQLVEETYNGMDDNVYRLERALEISTQELQDLNDNLEKRITFEVASNIEKDKKLLTQSRSASMGEMIGNIAHQWRQPLSAISSTSSSMLLQLQLNLASEKDMENSYNKILEYTGFLTQTIEDFRDFFKRDKSLIKFDMLEYMNKTINIIDSTYKNSGIEILEDKKKSAYISLGFPNELTQVFLNILNNAQDALLETNSEVKFVFIEYKQSDEYNTVYITDTAGGVPSDIIPKIFDPYFTTKHKAQGTGIGLYMCKQIIEKHVDGILNVENKEIEIANKRYKGACFSISLSRVI